jgi:hypothetical protein
VISSLLSIFGKYREHAILFGSGLLGGLLLFLVWFAFQPSLDKDAPAADAAAGAEAGKPTANKDGVLDDIAGDFQPGDSRAVVELDTAPDSEIPNANGSLGAADDVDPDVVTPPTDEEAIAGGLLGPEDGAAQPKMQIWYVEVARGPGVTEVLEIEAPTPEQALGVIRDFRGNPRVLRGPSNQPLP